MIVNCLYPARGCGKIYVASKTKYFVQRQSPERAGYAIRADKLHTGGVTLSSTSKSLPQTVDSSIYSPITKYYLYRFVHDRKFIMTFIYAMNATFELEGSFKKRPHYYKSQTAALYTADELTTRDGIKTFVGELEIGGAS